jgi:hypothetical protein
MYRDGCVLRGHWLQCADDLRLLSALRLLVRRETRPASAEVGFLHDDVLTCRLALGF